MAPGAEGKRSVSCLSTSTIPRPASLSTTRMSWQPPPVLLDTAIASFSANRQNSLDTPGIVV